MADPKGFIKIKRQKSIYRPVYKRVKDYKEVIVLRDKKDSESQASRCMDCGTPFCHWACPVGNYIPEWNDYMFRGNWKAALVLLDATNNLPEITGRVCPALCEYVCVLAINDDAVTIRENELAVIEFGFKKGLIRPNLINKRTGRKIAVIGSGPAGLSCAAQLNKAGHNVVVFERDKKPGGILRYGIPDFKLEKHLIDRRIDIWKKEGIVFETGVDAGIDYPARKLLDEFDAVCLAGGARVPRDLKIEGRELKGIYFAMDYLTCSNKTVSDSVSRHLGDSRSRIGCIDARDKKVLIIGGGDTGADCVGTAHRQGAKSVVQIEVLPKPSECRPDGQPWPKYPMILKTSSSHEEGGERRWAILTKKFIGENGLVKKILCVKVDFQQDEKSCPVMKEISGSEFEIDADLVILAIGFAHPEHPGLLEKIVVEFDQRGNVKTDNNYMTSVKGVFSAGDMRRGQSLVVWAISEGRRAARSIDKFLMGKTYLPML